MQFTRTMSVVAANSEKFTKTSYLEVQRRSRSYHHIVLNIF